MMELFLSFCLIFRLEIKKAKQNIAFQRARDWWSLYFLSISRMVIEKNELKSQIAGNFSLLSDEY